jgi:hypothetical protein
VGERPLSHSIEESKRKLVAGEEVWAIVRGQHGKFTTRAAQEVKPALRLVIPDGRILFAVPHHNSHYRHFDAAA